VSESKDANWDDVRGLESSVIGRGEPLILTAEVRAILRRSAKEVAMSDTEAEVALGNTATATDLLREIRRRIREGSDRISDALHRMYRLQEKGDLDGARQQMRDVLALEVVPLYREIAEGELEKMDETEE
jgi:DUSAM domain-containing protein